MAEEKKPILIYFMINIAVIAVIIFSSGYVYLKFFNDKISGNGETANIEKNGNNTQDVSRQVSKAAFRVAVLLAVVLLSLYLLVKRSSRIKSKF